MYRQLFLIFFLSAVVLSPVRAQTLKTDIETLFYVKLEGQVLRIGVISNGCTEASHFSISLVESKLGPRVSISRDVTDNCRAASRVIDVAVDLPRRIEPNEAVEIRNRFGSY